MKKLIIMIFATAALNLSAGLPVSGVTPAMAANASTQSATKTLKMSIDHMTCAMCPVTVRKAVEHVHGVQSVDVDFEKKSATVVYDPAAATPEDIADASTNAGYPAHPIKQ